MSQSPTADTVPAGKTKATKAPKVRTPPKAKSKSRSNAAAPAEAATVSADGQPPDGTEAEQRRKLIAEAAYLRAERRGFEQGDPMQDWLEAEREVDQRLHGT